MKYQRRNDPKYIVKAFQYDGDFIDRDGQCYVPKWGMKALKDGILKYRDQGVLCLGREEVKTGSWIIKVEGKFGILTDPDMKMYYEPVRSDDDKTIDIMLSKADIAGLIFADQMNQNRKVVAIGFEVEEDEDRHVTFKGVKVTYERN